MYVTKVQQNSGWHLGLEDTVAVAAGDQGHCVVVASLSLSPTAVGGYG